MLVLFRPFHIGDRIETGGIIGTTREINLFYSELDTDDNVRVIIPNGKLWGEIVQDPVAQRHREASRSSSPAPLNDDIEMAVEPSEASWCSTTSASAGSPRSASSTVNEGNYVLVAAHVWVPRRDAMQARFDLNRAVKEEFQRRPPTRGGGARRRLGASIAAWRWPFPSRSLAWKAAPFALEGETVFAVGDVHGCAVELVSLLDAVRMLARDSGSRADWSFSATSSIADPTRWACSTWAEDAAAHGVDRMDRIIGNHEILMLLAMAVDRTPRRLPPCGWPSGPAAKVLAEMRAAVRARGAPHHALATAALGEAILDRLLTQRSHVRLGNAVFVHGGLDPQADPDDFLAPPWTAGTDARWAWITTDSSTGRAGSGARWWSTATRRRRSIGR